MHLKSLDLVDFRNFEKVGFQFSEGINFIIGENGTGKTNLLEAIYLLGNGVSLKKSHLRYLVRIGQELTTIEGKIVDEIGASTLQIELRNGKRTIFKDGNPVKLMRDFLGSFLVLGFSPDNLGLIKGGSLARRSLVDKQVIDLHPEMIGHYGMFSRSLLHKRSLLKDGSAIEHLEPWNRIIARCSSFILRERAVVVSLLNSHVPGTFQNLFGVERCVSLEYRPTYGGLFEEEAIYELLQKNRIRELRMRRPLIGPHLDDIEIRLDGKPIKEFASQGQIRSVAIALLLANAEILEEKLGRIPILVLDDVDSELDEIRKSILLTLVTGSNRQVFISSTDARFRQDVRFANSTFVTV